MFKPLENVEIQDGKTFSGHTLILSAVSVGNVGQLVVDVILSNAGPTVPQKIGRIFHPGIEAVVGTDPCTTNGDSSRLVTSCEGKSFFNSSGGGVGSWIIILRYLYQNHNLHEKASLPEEKFVIVQFHSPVTMKRRDDFVEFLCCWIKRQNFKHVVCFSSTFAGDRNDQQLVGVPLRFIATDEAPPSITGQLLELGWNELEKRQFPAPAIIDKSKSSSTDSGVLHLPGSGITLRMFEKCQEIKIPFIGLIMFASEGDNTPEALTMYEAANKLFPFVSNKSSDDKDNQPINIPATWSYFHGRSHPLELY